MLKKEQIELVKEKYDEMMKPNEFESGTLTGHEDVLKLIFDSMGIDIDDLDD